MIDIRTGRPLTRRDFGAGIAAILAAGVAPSVMAFGRRGLGLRMASGGKSLPYKRRLAYLESHGTEWIDTGYTPSWDNVIETQIKLSVGSQCPFGCLNLTYVSNYCRWFNSVGLAHGLTTEIRRIVFDGINKIVLVDGVRDYVESYKTAASGDLWLFGRSDTRVLGASRNYGWREVEADGTIVIDLIPVMTFDDEPCMYDKVSGRFLRNAGTGAFGYGEMS